MTWYELINKPLIRRGFEWDGTMQSVRGHLSDEEMAKAKPRLCRDEQGPYLMLDTLHDWSRTRPGDWIIVSTWPKTGIEVYSVKPQVLQAAYEVGKAIEFDPTATQ